VDNGLQLACEYVDPGLLDDDEKRDNLAELAAWKWRTKYNVFSAERSAMSYHLAISSTRRDEPCFRALVWGTDSGSFSRSCGGAKAYRQPRRKIDKGFPLLIPMRGKLPTYEEALEEEIDVSSVELITKEKK